MKRGNTPTFTLRLPPELRAQLQSLADADGRSLANYVSRVLHAHTQGATVYPVSLQHDPIVAEASPASFPRDLAAKAQAIRNARAAEIRAALVRHSVVIK